MSGRDAPLIEPGPSGEKADRSPFRTRAGWTLLATVLAAVGFYFAVAASSLLFVLAILGVVALVIAALVVWGIWVLNNLPV
jgi:small basic protein